MAYLGNRILNRFASKDTVTGALIPTIITRQIPPGQNVSYDLQGNYQNTAQTGVITFPCIATIQPLRGREVEQIPEGYREKQVVSIECDTVLQCLDQSTQTVGDTFQWNGRTYQVFHAETPDGAQQMDINYWEGYGFLVPIDAQATS